MFTRDVLTRYLVFYRLYLKTKKEVFYMDIKSLPKNFNDEICFDKLVKYGKRMYNEREEIELLKLAQKGNKLARNKIIENNLLFVVSACRMYDSRLNDFNDLVGEAILGIDKAIQKYDFRADVKFLSFAVWWIKSYLMRIAFDNSVVTTPAVNYRLSMIKKKLLNGEKLTDTEIKYKTLYSHECSLDATISSANDSPNPITLADTIPSDYRFENDIEYKDLYNKVMKEIEQIDGPNERRPIYKEVIDELCLGDETNQGLGEKFGLSTERIRQIRKKVIGSLQKNIGKRLKEEKIKNG
jgi:RNA polymerase primary sigma factor